MVLKVLVCLSAVVLNAPGVPGSVISLHGAGIQSTLGRDVTLLCIILVCLSAVVLNAPCLPGSVISLYGARIQSTLGRDVTYNSCLPFSRRSQCTPRSWVSHILSWSQDTINTWQACDINIVLFLFAFQPSFPMHPAFLGQSYPFMVPGYNQHLAGMQQLAQIYAKNNEEHMKRWVV